MPTQVITLEIDRDAAQVFTNASHEEHEKLAILLGIWLKEFAQTDLTSLKKIMDEISFNAQNRGLTPEILDAIL